MSGGRGVANECECATFQATRGQNMSAPAATNPLSLSPSSLLLRPEPSHGFSPSPA